MKDIDKYIFDLKKEYENVFEIKIQGEEFIFRPLSKFEYNNLIIDNDEDLENISEEVCELCTFYPDNYDFEHPHAGGATTALCKEIINTSGFANKELIKNLISMKNNENANDLSRVIENIILFAFDQFDLEDIRNWDIYKLIDVYTRALWTIVNLMPDVNLPDVVKTRPPQQSSYEGQQQVDPHQIMQKSKTMRTMGDNFR